MSLFLVLQAALGTPGLVGLFAVIVGGIIYVIRKKFGPQWERLVGFVPALNFDMTPWLALLSKLVQALPGTVLAAVLGAVTSGGSLVPTLVSALAGLLAAIGHEVLKAIPQIPYKGETGEAKLPSPPKVPTGLLTIVLVLSVFACGPTAIKDPCSAADKAEIERVYIVEAVKCFNADTAVEESCLADQKAIRAKTEEKCR